MSRVVRGLALALLTLCLARSGWSQTIYPYEWVFEAGSNNVVDSNASSCSSTEGCFDNDANACRVFSGEICRLQTVPVGHCSYGPTSACVWPHHAGHCASDPNIGC